MADVTEDDWNKAVSLLPDHQTWCQWIAHGGCCAGPELEACDCGIAESRAATAEALADEREKARAPFARLADEIQAATGDRQDVVSATMRDDAALIRATLDDNR